MTEMDEPKDDADPLAQFVLNDLVGATPESLLPVVREEVAEDVRQRRLDSRLRPSEARAVLDAVMGVVEWEEWEAGCVGAEGEATDEDTMEGVDEEY